MASWRLQPAEMATPVARTESFETRREGDGKLGERVVGEGTREKGGGEGVNVLFKACEF